jgi:hypothetical protein
MVPVELVSATSRAIATGAPAVGLYFEFKVAAQPERMNVAKQPIAVFRIAPPMNTIADWSI